MKKTRVYTVEQNCIRPQLAPGEMGGNPYHPDKSVHKDLSLIALEVPLSSAILFLNARRWKFSGLFFIILYYLS